jgi:RNA polymerase primary sigma factor
MAKKDEDKVDNEATATVDAADGPLLDLNDAAVKRMIKLAKKRGFVTYAELNAVLPSEEVSSDQIEDVYAMLSEMGITVSEGDDPDDVEEEAQPEEEEAEGGDLVESPRATAVATRASEPADRTDDPVRM